MFSHKKHFSKKFLIFSCIFLLATVISCTFEVGILQPTQTPTNDSDNEISGQDVTASIGTGEQEAHPTPSETDADCQESTLAGLVFGYRDQYRESLWQVGTCGGHFQLSTQSNMQISSDGSQALYTKDDDIWVVDLLSGDEQNLTNTPDRVEVYPQWWHGNENLVVFGSWGSSEDLGPTAGYLSLISADGGGYRVLVDQPSNTVAAPQPKGSKIAYDLGDTVWLYHMDLGESELFDVSLYGLNILKGMRIGSPSWSPDGKKLTWWVSGVFSPPQDESTALAVFNLDAGTVELMHPYTPIGTGGGLPAPIWSPDGNWLAANTLSEAHKTDLWAIRAEGGEEHLLGFASYPVWRPDSGALAYKAWPDDGIKLIELGDWGLETLDFPPGSEPLDWLGIILNFPSQSQPAISATDPSFGPDILFASGPDPAKSQLVFPYGTPEIFAIWPYRNMREGLAIRREWYLDGSIWIVREEPWDYARYGVDGILTDISVYDFDRGLEPGRYQLRLYIDGQEQRLGTSESFSSAFFEISAPIGISPHISPDYSQAAIVEPPGSLIIQDVSSQEEKVLLTVDEISSLAWYPDGKYILFSVRDRPGKQAMFGPARFVDELWVVNLETGETYPFQDQFGQVTGKGLHHPYISPDGLYIAAVGGTGWTDACFVDSTLWVKEIGFSGDRLHEVFSHYQHGFTIDPAPENGEMYVERIIGWDSPTLLKVELRWTCTGENLAGVYMLDMSTMTAEKIGGSE